MGRRFVSERRRDPYYRAAQREGLRSRAAFKLDALAQRYRLFVPGDAVLDLGAAPGGWSIVARTRVGSAGRVVAVDPRPIEPIDGVEVIRRRVGDPALAERLGDRRFDVVISDMSPSISGAYATDHARSVDLARSAFALCDRFLMPRGRFVAKLFAGDLLEELVRELHPNFRRVVRTKPPASRERSSEIYLLGLEFRPSPRPGPGP
ncbi:MAG: RlmE family RNA methyltransferase [Thermoplasmata archaeon]|nr:RlmE family RNA methyltransferase [Thermoplasmata archaeon]